MTAEMATAIQAASAFVQAVAALVIVVLTIWLARTARNALRESARQAKAAETASEQAERALEHAAEQARQAVRANDESRRQRHAAAIPLVDVRPVLLSDPGDPLWVTFLVRNPGPAPALDVRLLLFGVTTMGGVEESERSRSRPIPMLAPGEEQEINVDLEPFRNVPNPHLGSPSSERFSNDWIRVNAMCQGLLGARASHRYDWHANEPPKAWQLVEVKYLPDPSDLSWQVVLDTKR